VASSTRMSAPSRAGQKRYRDLPPKATEELEPLTPYSFAEAVPFLRMTEKAVARRVDLGEIGHVRIGRRRLILGRQIKAYIEGNEVPPLARRGRRGGAR
jgi:hypothetical protein